VATDVIPAGLPSDLLRRRPDVRRSERQLAGATARIGVATAELFPKFNLTGTLGQQSLELKNFANSASTFWSFGPSVSWALFSGGRIRANIEVQEARTQQAFLNYRKQVLISLQDVETTMSAYQAERARRQALAQAVQASLQAYDLALKQYNQGGVIDYLVVLDSQRSLFAAQEQLAQSDALVSANLVAVYKALGGGW
jgi:NodT family efflux transporter outer membrane factor (OMF) lipoprotein